MKVFEVMSEQVATIDPDSPVATARQVMATKGVHHLAVVRDGVLEGVLSSRDLDAGAPAARSGDVAVSTLMTRPVVTVGRNTKVTRAANLMAGRSIGSLVVTDRGRVIGIVTISDLLNLVGRGAGRQPRRAGRAALNTRVPHRKQRGAGGAW